MYAPGWRNMPDDDPRMRMHCIAMEWWAMRGDNEAATRFMTGSSSSDASFPVNVFVRDRGSGLATSIVRHTSDESSIEFRHVDRSVCNACGARFERRLQRCARCGLVYYCSRECQRADWNDHKANCVSRTWRKTWSVYSIVVQEFCYKTCGSVYSVL